MFEHKNLAVQGLFPGQVTTRSIANLGTYETEVIIEPVIPHSSGGGGWGGFVPAPLHRKPTHFRVTVRIKYNGKWYEDTQIVDEKQARVIATLKGIKNFSTNNVMVSVNGVQIYEQEQITITVNRIATTSRQTNGQL